MPIREARNNNKYKKYNEIEGKIYVEKYRKEKIRRQRQVKSGFVRLDFTLSVIR